MPRRIKLPEVAETEAAVAAPAENAQTNAAQPQPDDTDAPPAEGDTMPSPDLIARHPLYSVVIAKAHGWPWWPGIVVPFAQHLFLDEGFQPTAPARRRICVLFFRHGGISELLPKYVKPWDETTKELPYQQLVNDIKVEPSMDAARAYLIGSVVHAERYVIARGRGWSWWPGMVVPYAQHYFLPEVAKVPKQKSNTATVLFFNNGQLAQIFPDDVKDFEGNTKLVKPTGKNAGKIRRACAMVKEYKKGIAAYKAEYAAYLLRQQNGEAEAEAEDGDDDDEEEEDESESASEAEQEEEEGEVNSEEEDKADAAPSASQNKRDAQVDETSDREAEDGDPGAVMPVEEEQPAKKRRSKRRKVATNAQPADAAPLAGATDQGVSAGVSDPSDSTAAPWVA